MNYAIIWSDQARADLQGIYDFIAQDSVYYAELEIVKIKMATDILVKHIHAGRIVPEIGNKDIREIIQGNYRIIYQISNSENIYIVTVHHAARTLSTEDLPGF